MIQLSKKSIVLTSIVALFAIPAVAFAAVTLTAPEKRAVPATASEKIDSQIAPVETVVTEIPPVVEAVAPQVVEVEVAPTPAPVPVPVVPSIQELGELYANVDNPLTQQCFDKIVAHYPERFTEDVRVNNVKSLRWFDVCWPRNIGISIAGYDENLPTRIEQGFGANGEYFDSEVAKLYHVY